MNCDFSANEGQTDLMENELMCNWDMKVRTFRSTLAGLAGMAIFSVLLAAYAWPASGQAAATKTFSSAEEASNALFQAAQTGDEQQLEAILGTGKEVTSSGDEVEDKLEREQFTKKYQEMHRLVQEGDGSTVLYIGAENWPFPIPLVSRKGAYRFDSDAGKHEILFRTIGENESTAIEVCDAFVAARKQGGATKTGDDPISEYAQKLALQSATDAANATPGNNSPFQGYHFQSQKSTGRVALIAYPAKYRSSGVMTFLVTEDGVVYEKDLGPKTTTVAPNIKIRSPRSSWHRVD